MSEIFLDVETKRLQHEVPGGWNNIRGFGLAVAVTWNEETGFRTWTEDQAQALIDELLRMPQVVGYNLLRFDYAVLSAYRPDIVSLLQHKTTDMLVALARRLGFRPSLESVAHATLGRTKKASGRDAVDWFRSGEIAKVVAYCQDDVSLARDIFYYGRQNGYVLYLDRGRPTKVLVRW